MPEKRAEGGKIDLEPIELEPGYTTFEMPGRCAKCLVEEEYGICMRQMLKGDDERPLKERFEVVRAFLTSPDLAQVRDESEKYLSDGKRVKILVHLEEGQPKYEIKVEEKE
ncbi:MAG: hypothetical protein PHV74_08340 [Dehalococcoidia bacterium]|nr:hypothetical protein [Dehalococcoidia bacterium]